MKIRPATTNDTDSLLNLIHELAIFEKEPDAVKTTKEDLLRDGFSDSPYFQTLVIEDNQKIMGMALYFFSWSTWEGRPSLFLEDLIITESGRGNGYGLALLKELARIAVEKNCARFEWEVLDWNMKARDFYHSIGAHHKKGWLPYRVDGEELIKLAQKD